MEERLRRMRVSSVGDANRIVATRAESRISDPELLNATRLLSRMVDALTKALRRECGGAQRFHEVYTRAEQEAIRG